MKRKPKKVDNKRGRPPRAEPPRIDYQEVDKLLVFGEVVPTRDGKSTTVIYPTYRQIARRFGVSHSLICLYAKKHNCTKRRKDAQAQVAMKVDSKLIEARATAIAVSKEDALRIIDTYLVGFERAFVEDRIRFDSPSDFNMMVRLKEFIQGGADSRQEIYAALSLEDIQARHKQMLRIIEDSSAKERGEVGAYNPASLIDSKPIGRLNPPRDSFDFDDREMTGHFSDEQNGRLSEKAPLSRNVTECAPNEQSGDNPSNESDEANTGAPVANVGQTCGSKERDDDQDANKSGSSDLFILPPAPDTNGGKR
jgi:hypothetical protein